MEKHNNTTAPIIVPSVVSNSGSLIIEQSDELLHEVDYRLPKASRLLQTHLRYSITNEALKRLHEQGIDAFTSELSTFEFDISSFYDEFVSVIEEDGAGDKRKRHDISDKIKKAENSLIRPLCMCNEDGTIREYLALYNSLKINDKARTCTVKVDNRVLPLFVPEINQIKERHLLDLARVYSFTNQGASKLYALVNGTVQQLGVTSKDEYFSFDLTYLKKLFGISQGDTNYTTKYFMSRLFVPAYEEIIHTSDIRFQYELVKQRRIIVSVKIHSFERIPDEFNKDFFKNNSNDVIDVDESQIRVIDSTTGAPAKADDVENIVSLFSDECRSDGFTVAEDIFKLLGAFGGNIDNYKKARNAYHVMAELNAVGANMNEKLEFFLNLSKKL